MTVTTGNAFDIVAKKTVLKKNDVSNGYDATVKLEVTNHSNNPQNF